MSYNTYILDRILSERSRILEEERGKLLETTKMILISIREKYCIKEAYITGSLIKGGWSEDSDIDVAVSGASQFIFEIMKELEDATEREVDVIDLDCHPYPEVVRARGRRVYG